MGHKVFETSRIEEAERFLKTEDIDCFITDYSLKHNPMNGLAFYNKIRKEGFNKPVIFITLEEDIIYKVAGEDEKTMVIIKENSFDEELKCTLHNIYARFLKQ